MEVIGEYKNCLKKVASLVVESWYEYIADLN